MDFLRRADWLDADRATAYVRLLGGALLIFTAFAVFYIFRPAFSVPNGRAIGSDFDAFWSGARLAWLGHPQLAYDGPSILRMENAQADLGADKALPYVYPPVFMLLCLPLGALPYRVALPVFFAACYAANAALLMRILPQRWAILPILVLPAATMNIVIGQNGLLSSAIFASAFLLMERRPTLAGACLGLLAYKPHLAICIPVALLAAGRTRALAACAASALALAALSWLAFGTATWAAFFGAFKTMQAIDGDSLTVHKMVSMFGAVRLLHGSVFMAYTAQAIVSVGALLVAAAACARRPGPRAEIAIMTAATLLCNPHVLDYDLACLSVPVAWMAGEWMRNGVRDWEKLGVASAYVLPLGAQACNSGLGVPVAGVFLPALLALVVARAWNGHQEHERMFFFEKKNQKLLLRCRGLMTSAWLNMRP